MTLDEEKIIKNLKRKNTKESIILLNYIDKLEEKLMYALSPTTHELAEDTKNDFKNIIRENLKEDTYTIRKKLKDYWEGK